MVDTSNVFIIYYWVMVWLGYPKKLSYLQLHSMLVCQTNPFFNYNKLRLH